MNLFFLYLMLLITEIIHKIYLNLSRYDTKQSDGEVPVMLSFGNVEHPFIAIAPRSILAQSGIIYGSNRTKLRTYAN